MKRTSKGMFWFVVFCVLAALCVIGFAAPAHGATNTPETDELGVVVTNETNTNIIVFSTAGAQGCTVPPGGFCFAQCPPGWNHLTIKVVRCGKDGDMEDPDDLATFRMDAVKIHRVQPREF